MTVVDYLQQLLSTTTTATVEIASRNARLLIFTLKEKPIQYLSARQIHGLAQDLATEPSLSADMSDSCAGTEHSRICPNIIAATKLHLRHELRGLVLKFSLLCQISGSAPDPGLTINLLGLYDKNRYGGDCQCPHEPVLEKTNLLSSIQIQDTPNSNITSINWRQQLQNTMIKGTQQQHLDLMQMVEVICGDLEKRCDEAEVPYREEQDRSQELLRQLQEKDNICTTLQLQTANLQTRLEESNSRARQSDDEAAELHQQIEKISDELKNAKNQYQQGQEKLLSTSERAAAAARRQDLTYIETIKRKDDVILRYEQSALTAKVQNEHLSHQLSILEESYRIKENDSQRAETENTVLKGKLEDLETLLTQKETLLNHGLDLKTTVERMYHDIKEEQRDINAQRVLANEDFRKALEDIRDEHQTAIDGNDERIQQKDEELQEMMRKHREELKSMEEEREIYVHANSIKLTDLATRNIELSRECQVRAEEVTRIREASIDLVKVMGLRSTNSPAHSNTNDQNSQGSISTVSLDPDPTLRRNVTARELASKRSKIDVSPKKRKAQDTSGPLAPGDTNTTNRKTLGTLDMKMLNGPRIRESVYTRRSTIAFRPDFEFSNDQENERENQKLSPENPSFDQSDPYGSTASL